MHEQDPAGRPARPGTSPREQLADDLGGIFELADRTGTLGDGFTWEPAPAAGGPVTVRADAAIRLAIGGQHATLIATLDDPDGRQGPAVPAPARPAPDTRED